VTALAASLRATWLRLAVSQETVAVTCLGVLVAIFATLTWHTWGDLGRDTGYDLVAGSRVAHGQLPYIDYLYYYGPLAPFLLGFAYLFGSGVTPALVFGLLVASAIVGTTYVLARTQTGPTGAFLAAAIVTPLAFAPNNLSFVLAHTYSAPLGLLCALLLALAGYQYARTRTSRWALAVGSAAGVGMLTRPDFAVAILFATAGWLLLRRRAGVALPRELALVGGPALALPLAAYAPFAIATSPHRLLFENLYPVDTMRIAGNAVVRTHAPFTAGSFATILGYLALYALGCAGLVALARLLGRRAQLGAVLFCAGALAVLAANPEAIRSRLDYVFGWIPAGALLVLALYAIRERARSMRWDAREQAALIATIVLAVIGATTYAAFFLFATRPQVAVYAAPFAAILLARLHLDELARFRGAWALGAAWLVFLAATGAFLTVKDARAKTAELHSPGGTIFVAPQDAAAYRVALARIEADTRPGEPILLVPQLTALYGLSGRTDPLPEISLLPGALPDAPSEQRAIATLDRKHVRFVITDDRRFTEYDHTSFGGSFDRRLAAWIKRNFVPVSHAATATRPVHKLVIWLRRSQ
jgi:4-amino-4-deoxy-L-arabinose transferase-like glycosyltransferase